MAEEEVHFNVAEALKGDGIDGFVRGGHNGHGELKVPEVVAPDVSAMENLVLDFLLHRLDIVLQAFGVDKLLCVMHREGLDKHNGESWVRKHLAHRLFPYYFNFSAKAQLYYLGSLAGALGVHGRRNHKVNCVLYFLRDFREPLRRRFP